MEEETLKKVLQRLNILINLDLSPISPDKSTDKEKIDRLNSFGLKPAEIAEILGTTSDRVSKQLYVIKTRGKSKHA